MWADLHCHSYYSDGSHAPEFLLQRAISNGISHLAITDHDCLQAFKSLENNPDREKLILIPGVEISTLENQREIHVLGLAVTPGDSALNQLLLAQQELRQQRVRTIDERLCALGITGLNNYMATLPSTAPGRSQIADFLVAQGACRDRQQAFSRFLGRRGRCYVAPHWCSMTTAINTIQNADGIAILAHPHRYSSSTSGLRRLMTNFRQCGGDAVEVACGNLDGSMLEKLARLSQETGLLASCGSDFHSSSAHWTDLGKLPELPALVKKNAIWSHPRWHLCVDRPGV